MMKLIHSFIHYLCPPAYPGPACALHLVGCLHTLLEMGARVPPSGTIQRGALVDNFSAVVGLTDARFFSTERHGCKCLNVLSIPDNVRKVAHNAHFIQRALC